MVTSIQKSHTDQEASAKWSHRDFAPRACDTLMVRRHTWPRTLADASSAGSHSPRPLCSCACPRHRSTGSSAAPRCESAQSQGHAGGGSNERKSLGMRRLCPRPALPPGIPPRRGNDETPSSPRWPKVGVRPGPHRRPPRAPRLESRGDCKAAVARSNASSAANRPNISDTGVVITLE